MSVLNAVKFRAWGFTQPSLAAPLATKTPVYSAVDGGRHPALQIHDSPQAPGTAILIKIVLCFRTKFSTQFLNTIIMLEDIALRRGFSSPSASFLPWGGETVQLGHLARLSGWC